MRFILNDKEVSTDLPGGTLLLDYIRYHLGLKGTKIGCREGDCGACTVLVGEYVPGSVRYRSVTSCLTALGNIKGRHVVTVEGVNEASTLNPIQQAMCDEAATQCGFCTPGFVVSLAGFCLAPKEPNLQNAIASIDGNICRCTGYKSIERAAARVSELMQVRNGMEPIEFATSKNLLPGYFATIPGRLAALRELTPANGKAGTKFLGGGTDLYVQQHDNMHEENIQFLIAGEKNEAVVQEGNRCFFEGSATVTDLLESPVMQRHFASLGTFTKLVSSTPIRNIATIAGNFINASPIGDFTIFFLALDAQLVFSDGINRREIPLRRLYKGYKTLNRKPEEYIERVWFELPGKDSKFHFEKVSKRTHLDIASVNTAIHLKMRDPTIIDACLSAGGVGPIPLVLKQTSAYLRGKQLDAAIVSAALGIAVSEITPISDARGSAEYKRLLLRQLIKSHFIRLFPALTDSVMHL